MLLLTKNISGEPDSFEGYSDEFGLEDVHITVSDFIKKSIKGNFSVAWEDLGACNELQDSYSLTEILSLKDAVESLIEHLGKLQ